MSKRKDKKGRNLRDGEVQRKDGSYMYRYMNRKGERKAVYSWRLVDTDKIPEGKRSTKPLRDREKEIQVALDSEDSPPLLTVNEVFENFMEMRTDLRESTRYNYIHNYNKHVAGVIGDCLVSEIKSNTLLKLYISLSRDKHLKDSTVRKIHTYVSEIFEYAVRGELISITPAHNAIRDAGKTLSKVPDKRHALTEEQQECFVNYIYSSFQFRRWGTLVIVLLGTGLRIGEALGLRWCDCDFEKNTISVNHALAYVVDENTGNYRRCIYEPKTQAGLRTIPMFAEVKRALESERELTKQSGRTPLPIDGYSDFIFCNDKGLTLTPLFVRDNFTQIINSYNRQEMENAEAEGRVPVLLPRFTPHNLRHTFCTRLCENGTNLKVVQDVMGHTDIKTTMNVYNEVTDKKRKEAFEKLEGKVVMSQILYNKWDIS